MDELKLLRLLVPASILLGALLALVADRMATGWLNVPIVKPCCPSMRCGINWRAGFNLAQTPIAAFPKVRPGHTLRGSIPECLGPLNSVLAHGDPW